MLINYFSSARRTRRSTPRAYRTGLLTSLVLAAACGGATVAAPSGSPVTAATVNATPAIQFTPPAVNLQVGGTVTFAFGGVQHDVYFDNAPAGAPQNITAPTSNSSVTRTFTTAGKFVYNCHIHPGMSGTITVQ